MLEELYCGNLADDVWPQNEISYIDLSNNPNIHTVFAENMSSFNWINLKNGNNDSNMFININAGYWVDEGEFYGNVCIEVDNAVTAQNNQYPYSEWTIYHSGKTYSYADNIEDCSLSSESFAQNKISIYPNPVTDILYFDTTDTIIEKVMVYNLSGRKIMEQNQVNTISVSDLQKGNYILKILSDKGIQTEKIIVK